MGAWYCEGEGCDATIPGAHPMEYGDEGWDPKVDPMLCRACTAELAFEIAEQWVQKRLDVAAGRTPGPKSRTVHEELEAVQEMLRRSRRDIDRAETFNPST